MTKKTKTNAQATKVETKGGNGTPVILGKAEAEAKLAELQDRAKAKRDSERQAKWEAEKKAANPQYVVGSVRNATSDDLREFAKRGATCHGRVGEIVCAECGVKVVRNTQDLHQSRYCDEHKKKASNKRAANRRKAKREAGRTVEVISAEIAALTAELGEETVAKAS